MLTFGIINWLTAHGITIITAIITGATAWLVAISPKKGSIQNSQIDQYQEGIDSYRSNENSQIDQLQEDIKEFRADIKEIRATVREQRKEINILANREIAFRQYIWSLQDHILRGNPPPPPEMPEFLKNKN